MEPELKSPSTGDNEKIEPDATVEQVTKFLALATTGAAAVAIAFDIGYFTSLDINMFTLFSLSEHVLFSLEAAPIAFALLVSSVVLRSIVSPVGRQIKTRFIDVEVNKKKLRYIIVQTILITLLICAVVVFAIYVNIMYIAFLFLPAFMVLYLSTNISRQMSDIISEFTLLYIIFFTYAYVDGALVAQAYTSYDAKVLHQLITKDRATLGGRLIRSGERGVLFFDTEKKQVAFLRWENIDSIRGLPRSSPPTGTVRETSPIRP
jgi:hypothetical protein